MAYNPHEKTFISNIEDAKSGALFERAFREVEALLNSNKIRVEDFRDIYGEERVRHALDYVAKREKEREGEDPSTREARKLALMCEGLVYKGGNEYGWFGENARIIKTSDYDDWKGVDGVIEFRSDDERTAHTAFGVDVTYGADSTVGKKFDAIRRDIEGGKLSVVEYFKSGNFRGELSLVPRVVVGAEKKHVLQIFGESDSGKLSRHPYQLLQLREMRLQLEAFARFAKKNNQQEVAAVLERDGEIVRKLAQQKSVAGGIRLTEELKNDKVFLAIQKELEKF